MCRQAAWTCRRKPFGYFTTSSPQALTRTSLMRWRVFQVAGAAGLAGPHKGERGHVVWNEGFASGLSYSVQNRCGNRLSVR